MFAAKKKSFQLDKQLKSQSINSRHTSDINQQCAQLAGTCAIYKISSDAPVVGSPAYKRVSFFIQPAHTADNSPVVHIFVYLTLII